jgi:glycosyltransferase involved in cell wall biosynthesis
MVKLSIIIPYYNTYKYTKKLLNELIKQLNNEVEIILIDDGCNEKRLDKYKEIKVIHLKVNSGNASIPRNIGLDKATGEYITFIDSDDMISGDYIEKIFKKINKNPDIIFISWKSKKHYVIMENKPPRWNCSVWCRVYKRDIVKKIRFNKELNIAEDWEFNEQVKYKTSLCIKDIIYFYNNNRKGSLTNER